MSKTTTQFCVTRAGAAKIFNTFTTAKERSMRDSLDVALDAGVVELPDGIRMVAADDPDVVLVLHEGMLDKLPGWTRLRGVNVSEVRILGIITGNGSILPGRYADESRGFRAIVEHVANAKRGASTLSLMVSGPNLWSARKHFIKFKAGKLSDTLAEAF